MTGSALKYVSVFCDWHRPSRQLPSFRSCVIFTLEDLVVHDFNVGGSSGLVCPSTDLSL